MDRKEIKQILNQLTDHEVRISTLESQSVRLVASTDFGSGKQKTLREIVKGRKFKNGQEQIAIIVGYHEDIIVPSFLGVKVINIVCLTSLHQLLYLGYDN